MGKFHVPLITSKFLWKVDLNSLQAKQSFCRLGKFMAYFWMYQNKFYALLLVKPDLIFEIKIVF